MSETREAPATASALASLETRVARLEADVSYIQRDVGSIKDDVKSLIRNGSEVRADVATLVERTTHLATREWVMWRMLAAFLILVAVLGTVTTVAVAYAPRLQVLFGTAPSSAPVPPAR